MYLCLPKLYGFYKILTKDIKINLCFKKVIAFYKKI